MPRPVKPTALKELDGTINRNKQRLNPYEPRLPPGTPDQDLDHLSPEARELWPTLVDVLRELGVLTKADGSSLYTMAEDLADLVRYRRLQQELASPFYETETEGGSIMIRPHPVHALVDSADKRWMAWASQFGLTPAARTKVVATVTEKPKNVFEDI